MSNIDLEVKPCVTISLQEFYRMIQGTGSLCEALTSISDGTYDEDIVLLEVQGLPVIPLTSDFTVQDACSWARGDIRIPSNIEHLLVHEMYQTLQYAIRGNRFLKGLEVETLLEKSLALGIAMANPDAEWVLLDFGQDGLELYTVIVWHNNSLYAEFIAESKSLGLIVLRNDYKPEQVPTRTKKLLKLLMMHTDLFKSDRNIVFDDKLNYAIKQHIINTAHLDPNSPHFDPRYL
ncbi:hypothetical protein PR1_19 [Providencia phage vB_PreS_PR1]|uniref:Uncharacterized protein n=1 Tax=Providencia phage vB_PreS_PR1 TaxID=1931407 RepID=A0A1S6KUX5_9CAUD|nr:hypothetical protein FDH30_gp019 [Providencia phage vB_PreS_PR1]AQT25247.1 hypothetical protein PR1_19 [Providencia phage vB_PreS_PR1]